jgi:hypothetical protein
MTGIGKRIKYTQNAVTRPVSTPHCQQAAADQLRT